MTRTIRFPQGRRYSAAGFRVWIGFLLTHLSVALSLLVLLDAPAHASTFIPPRFQPFYDAYEAAYKKAVAHVCLGRHGELIVPDFVCGGAERGWVHILKRDDGSYDLAAFVCPKQYYYGRITPSCDIIYNFDAGLPPGVDGTAFAGPLRWPFQDDEGRPSFERPKTATVVANRTVFPMPKVTGSTVRAVIYACADNLFYMFKGTEVLSPFAFFLVENAEKKSFDLVSPENMDAPFLSIIDGGWADSHIIFKRNTDNSVVNPECRFPWPYHDSKGKPMLPDTPKGLQVGEYVSAAWEVYDETGKSLGINIAPPMCR